MPAATITRTDSRISRCRTSSHCSLGSRPPIRSRSPSMSVATTERRSSYVAKHQQRTGALARRVDVGAQSVGPSVQRTETEKLIDAIWRKFDVPMYGTAVPQPPPVVDLRAFRCGTINDVEDYRSQHSQQSAPEDTGSQAASVQSPSLSNHSSYVIEQLPVVRRESAEIRRLSTSSRASTTPRSTLHDQLAIPKSITPKKIHVSPKPQSTRVPLRKSTPKPAPPKVEKGAQEHIQRARAEVQMWADGEAEETMSIVSVEVDEVARPNQSSDVVSPIAAYSRSQTTSSVRPASRVESVPSPQLWGLAGVDEASPRGTPSSRSPVGPYPLGVPEAVQPGSERSVKSASPLPVPHQFSPTPQPQAKAERVEARMDAPDDSGKKRNSIIEGTNSAFMCVTKARSEAPQIPVAEDSEKNFRKVAENDKAIKQIEALQAELQRAKEQLIKRQHTIISNVAQ